MQSYGYTIVLTYLGIFCASMWSYYSMQDAIYYQLYISMLMIHIAASYISSWWADSLLCVSIQLEFLVIGLSSA